MSAVWSFVKASADGITRGKALDFGSKQRNKEWNV